MWRIVVRQVGRWAPWLLWAAVMVAALAMVGLAGLNRGLIEPWESAVGAMAVLAYATPGALIVARRRGNPIGWLFLGVAALLATNMLAAQYAIFELRLASRFAPEPIVFSPMWSDADLLLLAQNPFARPATLGVLEPLGDLTFFGAFLLFTVAMTAPLFRYRQARPLARQQLRWFMFLAATIVVGFILVALTEDAGITLPKILDPVPIMLLGFPLAVSVAILRHKLYDLDVVINRTLIYGALTATLATVYFCSVVVLQLLLPERTELATVISTLAVAALFRPLRQRLQAWIDRRFYRRKYDAGRALADFAASARDEVDLERLLRALVEVVDETVQPTQVGVWLR